MDEQYLPLLAARRWAQGGGAAAAAELELAAGASVTYAVSCASPVITACCRSQSEHVAATDSTYWRCALGCPVGAARQLALVNARAAILALWQSHTTERSRAPFFNIWPPPGWWHGRVCCSAPFWRCLARCIRVRVSVLTYLVPLLVVWELHTPPAHDGAAPLTLPIQSLTHMQARCLWWAGTPCTAWPRRSLPAGKRGCMPAGGRPSAWPTGCTR